MVNQVAALALDDKGCGDHEYCYGNVSIVLGATAAEGAVRCNQQTGRAHGLLVGVGGKTLLGTSAPTAMSKMIANLQITF
jgi:hypothetical protein